MKNISVSEFETKLKDAGEIAAFKDLFFPFDFTVSQINCNCKRLTFENCEFSNTFEIKDIELNLGITFTNCTFNEHLIIQNVTIKDHFKETNIDYRNNSFLIEKCKISKAFSTNSCTFLRDLTIIDSTIHELIISSLISNEGSFNIKNSTVIYYVTVEQCILANSIKFIQVNCNDSLRFTNNEALSYLFEKNSFDSDSWIWYGKLKEGISIKDGIYKKEFIVESVDAKGCLSIVKAKFESNVSIAYECKNGGRFYRFGCPKIYLRDSEFNYGLSIKGKRFSEDNYPVEKIDIHLSQLMKGEINIEGCEISDLHITGTNYTCTLVLNDNSFSRITLMKLTNLGYVYFMNAKANAKGNEKNEFKVVNSHMGKTNFTNFSFDEFHDIEIKDSNFSEIITANIRWFDPEKLLIKAQDCKDFGRYRDLFRQLKYAMLKQGDRVQALFFKRYEMRSLRKQLVTGGGTWEDKAMLWMNQSNNHGQNWKKPLILGVLFTILFYIAFIISTAPELSCHISLSWTNVLTTLKVISKYSYIALKFLNPTHTYESLGVTLMDNFLGNLIDIVQRIVISYFIFQTISAFRKYIKE